MTDFWQFFSPDLRELLGEGDDPAFWQVAIDRILGDAVLGQQAHQPPPLEDVPYGSPPVISW